MISRLKGIPITYYAKVKTGVDAFNRDIIEEIPEIIENVVVTPVVANDVINTTNVSEDTVKYELCIPKGDTHEWRNVKVSFMGNTWKTIGDVLEYIDELVPLSWNKKIKVERYE